ncbi:MAG: PAS domain S-box protein [Alphaproteobacteria bacterium]
MPESRRNSLLQWMQGTAITVGVVVVFVAMAVGGGVLGVRSIAEATTEIIVYPFAVTNSALEARWNLTAIHRSVRDVVLAETDEQRAAAIADIIGREDKAIEHLRLVRERFHGDKRQVDSAIAAIEQWRPVREAVIHQALAGDYESATRTMKTQGTRYFTVVDENIDNILAISNAMARTLSDVAVRTAQLIITGTIAGAAVLAGLIVFGLTRWANAVKKSRALSERLAESEEQLRGARRISEDYLASRDLFSSIMHISADAIISVDNNQHIVLFNQGAERIFGYAADEVIGQPLDILLPPEVRAIHHEHVVDFGHSDDTSRRMGERTQVFGRRKNGQVFPAEASISRVAVEGRLTFTATLRDVTTQRETQRAIEALNADLVHRATQLESANRELEAFSYSVSHDLRAPLRAVDGFSQALMEDYATALPEEARDFLSRIRNASQRMGQLIDDMLNLSRVSRSEMRLQRLDLTAMARGIASDLAKSQPERAVEFVIADELVADGDPHLVQIVLTNLLGNAWKYTSKHPTARIEFGGRAAEDGAQAFFVRDDGAGFNMAYADKLFGAFQRLHGMDEYPGTGIGLVTAQRIVHRHGGRIWAEGAVEQGATFTFTLQ